MAEWSLLDEWPPDPAFEYPFYQEKPPPPLVLPPQARLHPPPSPTLTLLLTPPPRPSPEPNAPPYPTPDYAAIPGGENPREIRNKAEKQRRDKLNHSIAELAAMVPTVVSASRKVDKTGVLRLTAHYLRAHQYVFGDAINEEQQFNAASAQMLLRLLKGFLLTTTYRGLVVVVSKNVQQYLGYSELDLLGQNIFNIVHPEDLHIMRDNLMPQTDLLGPTGELRVPEDPDARRQLASLLANDKRSFVIRFKKMTQRSEPSQYVTCHIEGSLRKSDRARRGYSRCCQVVRRARARGDNPCNSGNDVVFIGLVRPTCETFKSESSMEAYNMEYRTRHSIDGEIIQCEQRIALVTGYMTHEVNGVNAMNFMHRDDVRWVIIALREMYDAQRVAGESCYRLMAKNGQFIYMRTRGQLDVDGDSRAVRSFVCTNTVVDEEEGKHLIRLMKRKFMLLVHNNENVPQEDEIKDVTDNQSLPLEDPRQLEKVILHLVTNLPSPQPDESARSPQRGPPTLPLAIIPPKRERIVSAIENFYTVFKTMDPVELPDPPPDTTTPMSVPSSQSTSTPSPQPPTAPQPSTSPSLQPRTVVTQTPVAYHSPLSAASDKSYCNCGYCSACMPPTCRANVFIFTDNNANPQSMSSSLLPVTSPLRNTAYGQVTREEFCDGQRNYIEGQSQSKFSSSSSSFQCAAVAGIFLTRPSSSRHKRPSDNAQEVTCSKRKSQNESNSEEQSTEDIHDNESSQIHEPNSVHPLTQQANQYRNDPDNETTTASNGGDGNGIAAVKVLDDPSFESSLQLLAEDPSVWESLLAKEALELLTETQDEN